MYTKAKIWNLALGALLLQRQISDPDTEVTNETKVLKTHWDTALVSTLSDMDLTSTKNQVTLELLATNDPAYPNWPYIYKYPQKCAFMRRLKSCANMDNIFTNIDKATGLYGTQKAIFTCEANAIAEIIQTDFPLSTLESNAGLAIAYKLAILSAPLITGKGAKTLRDEIQAKYVIAKSEAQEVDSRENFIFSDPYTESEFVAVRTS